MIFEVGSLVKLNDSRPGRIVSIEKLFGQDYADVFLEPSGPVLRFPVSNLSPRSDVARDLSSGSIIPAPLFLSRIVAHHLNALITQQGLLSASNFRITPLPHQILAVDFVLGQFRPRAMLAEEVGLGKTIEAAMIYEELKLRHQARRVIIITPAGLTRQWQDELSQKFGEQFVVMDRTLFSALQEIHGQNENLWLKHERVITSLDFIKPQKISVTLSQKERQRREKHNHDIFENLVSAGWDMTIIDEAHKLSKEADGGETARYKIGEALSSACPVFLLLTATPHQGKPGKFLHLLNLVDPYLFNSEEDLRPERVNQVVWRTRKRAAIDTQKKPLFKQRITDIYPIDRSRPEFSLERQLYDEVSEYVRDNYNRALGRNDRAFGFLMILFQRMLTSSTQAINDSLGKRLQKLVSWQNTLNGTQESGEFDDEWAEDEDSQELLNQLLDVTGTINRVELSSEIEILKRLLDLAKRVLRGSDAKMVALIDMLDEVRRREGPGTKFLIFTEFIATQSVLKDMLENLGYKVVCINGQMKLADRILARQDFSQDAQVMISTDAGGEGVNLQFCHVMINYDLPWNPAKLEQRIGRLDRIGQEHNVVVLNMLTKDTVDTRVRQVLEEKLALIRKQYGDDKLADILSTLQDEFRFDKLYMDALLKRQAESTELQAIGDQIYQRARQILDKDDLLLPHMKAEVDNYQQRLVEIAPDQIRSLLTGYLAASGETIKEYARRPGVYYFDLPKPDGSKEHFSEIVFDREKAVNDDGLTLLHFNHPLVDHLLKSLNETHEPSITQLRLRENISGIIPFRGTGYWEVYLLKVTDNVTSQREEIITVFLDANRSPLPRIARALLEIKPEQVDTAYLPIGAHEIQEIKQVAWELAERQANDMFSELQIEQFERIDAQRQKVELYFRQQEMAVRQIAIENIKQAKLREVLERRKVEIETLEKRRTLIPSLELVGMAVVTL